jgi:hypothetical protein
MGNANVRTHTSRIKVRIVNHVTLMDAWIVLIPLSVLNVTKIKDGLLMSLVCFVSAMIDGLLWVMYVSPVLLDALPALIMSLVRFVMLRVTLSMMGQAGVCVIHGTTLITTLIRVRCAWQAARSAMMERLVTFVILMIISSLWGWVADALTPTT